METTETKALSRPSSSSKKRKLKRGLWSPEERSSQTETFVPTDKKAAERETSHTRLQPSLPEALQMNLPPLFGLFMVSKSFTREKLGNGSTKRKKKEELLLSIFFFWLHPNPSSPQITVKEGGPSLVFFFFSSSLEH